MGRVGGAAPSDNIVATIVGVLGTITFPLAVPFAHRLSKAQIKQAIGALALVVSLQIAIFAQKRPFDDMHPSRMFIFRIENVCYLPISNSYF